MAVRSMQALTRAQREAIKRLFDRDADGTRSYLEFRRRASYDCIMRCVVLYWCGMWLGVEVAREVGISSGL